MLLNLCIRAKCLYVVWCASLVPLRGEERVLLLLRSLCAFARQAGWIWRRVEVGTWPCIVWEINKQTIHPDSETDDLAGPTPPTPPKNPSERGGGFAPFLFRWLLGRGGAVWTPHIDDFLVRVGGFFY